LGPRYEIPFIHLDNYHHEVEDIIEYSASTTVYDHTWGSRNSQAYLYAESRPTYFADYTKILLDRGYTRLNSSETSDTHPLYYRSLGIANKILVYSYLSFWDSYNEFVICAETRAFNATFIDNNLEKLDKLAGFPLTSMLPTITFKQPNTTFMLFESDGFFSTLYDKLIFVQYLNWDGLEGVDDKFFANISKSSSYTKYGPGDLSFLHDDHINPFVIGKGTVPFPYYDLEPFFSSFYIGILGSKKLPDIMLSHLDPAITMTYPGDVINTFINSTSLVLPTFTSSNTPIYTLDAASVGNGMTLSIEGVSPEDYFDYKKLLKNLQDLAYIPGDTIFYKDGFYIDINESGIAHNKIIISFYKENYDLLPITFQDIRADIRERIPSNIATLNTSIYKDGPLAFATSYTLNIDGGEDPVSLYNSIKVQMVDEVGWNIHENLPFIDYYTSTPNFDFYYRSQNNIYIAKIQIHQDTVVFNISEGFSFEYLEEERSFKPRTVDEFPKNLVNTITSSHLGNLFNNYVQGENYLVFDEWYAALFVMVESSYKTQNYIIREINRSDYFKPFADTLEISIYHNGAFPFAEGPYGYALNEGFFWPPTLFDTANEYYLRNHHDLTLGIHTRWPNFVSMNITIANSTYNGRRYYSNPLPFVQYA
jgi:hypothetical protein